MRNEGNRLHVIQIAVEKRNFVHRVKETVEQNKIERKLNQLKERWPMSWHMMVSIVV